MWYWVFKFGIIGPAALAWIGPRWRGRENLPAEGPFVIAANHTAYIDPAFISLGVPQQVIFVAKTKYYDATGRGRAVGWFLKAIGQTPVDPSTRESSAPAIETAKRLLGEGRVWAVFPEGTRSPDGRMHKGKTGVMRVALPTGAPVIPVAVTGTRGIDLSRPWRARRSRVTVTYGAPLDLSPWAGRDNDPVAWREATDALMARIRELSGQEYVDEYAARRDRADTAGDSAA